MVNLKTVAGNPRTVTRRQPQLLVFI